MSDPVRIPQPGELSEREKEDAMGAYLMMFATWAIGLPLPLLNLIAAVIYFYVNKKTSRFVAFHSYQSLLFHLPVNGINLAAIGWLLAILIRDLVFVPAFFVFLIFAGLVNLLFVIYSVIALVKARRGQMYYLPLFGRAAFARYYGPCPAPLVRPVEPNRPPGGWPAGNP